MSAAVLNLLEKCCFIMSSGRGGSHTKQCSSHVMWDESSPCSWPLAVAARFGICFWWVATCWEWNLISVSESASEMGIPILNLPRGPEGLLCSHRGFGGVCTASHQWPLSPEEGPLQPPPPRRYCHLIALARTRCPQSQSCLGLWTWRELAQGKVSNSVAGYAWVG